MVRRILTAITLGSCFGLMLWLIHRAWITEALSFLLVFIGCAAYLAWEMVRLIASTPKRREPPKTHPFDQQDTH